MTPITKTNEKQILSDLTVYLKYAKYLPEKKRRETWGEICNRYEDMMLKKYPTLTVEIVKNMEMVRAKKILPSMRALQFAGKPIETNASRLYNCCYLPVDNIKAFSETIFLLLGGTGVGFSVRKHHIAQLPPIQFPKGQRRYLVGDSIEGWADAIKMLMKAYFGESTLEPIFDLSDIRPKGAQLVTAGGKAPGPEPLRKCIDQVKAILLLKKEGEQLSSLECHDILSHLANAVLAGGIRRSAMISLFDADDNDMLECKSGNWWEENEQRGRANNSAVLYRDKVTKEEFLHIWKKIQDSGCGEPGKYLSNDKESGTNPCVEVRLRPFSFCNLTEINATTIVSQEDFNERAKIAAFFGTLQAGFTDFHYLRPIWKQTTEEDALIGVGITGIASGTILNLNLSESANIVKEENLRVATLIGINRAARATVVKPAGSTSLVCSSSSGIHAWHDKFYLRSIRVGKNEPIYDYFKEKLPNLVEDDLFNPTQGIVRIPQKAPENAITRDESVFDFLERVKKFNIEWVQQGFDRGPDHNNVSATVSIKPEEWEAVGEWMWKNKQSYSGLSVLPYDTGSYVQAPFETITEDRYNDLLKELVTIDLSEIIEDTDETDLKGEAACVGNGCELV